MRTSGKYLSGLHLYNLALEEVWNAGKKWTNIKGKQKVTMKSGASESTVKPKKDFFARFLQKVIVLLIRLVGKGGKYAGKQTSVVFSNYARYLCYNYPKKEKPF